MGQHGDDQDSTADHAGRPLVRAGSGVSSVGPLVLEEAIELLRRTGSLGSDSFSPGTASALDADSLLDLLERLHELTDSIAAVEIRATAALDAAVRRDSTDREESTATADRVLMREVSVVTRTSPSTASRRTKACRRLVRDMPVLLGALATGMIGPEKAFAAASTTSVLDSAQRGSVDHALGARLGDIAGAGQRQWVGEVHALVQLVDPHGERRRHEVARRGRSVTLRRRDHGMATLSINLPALDASLARKRLSLEGEKRRAGGDRRGHSAIMADTAADALIGRDGAIDPVSLDIGVIITDRALFCPDSAEPALIEGYGAVPVDQISESLRNATREPDPGGANSDAAATGDFEPDRPDRPALRATLRRLYTHPTSGELVAVESRARAFPPALSRFLRWRSMTCAGPFCNADIRHDDHIRPYSSGGHTCLDNGNGLCALCNGKETQGVIARTPNRPPGGAENRHRVHWETRYGSVVDVVPTPSELSAMLPRSLAYEPAAHGTVPQRQRPFPRPGQPLRPGRIDIIEFSPRTTILHRRRVRDHRRRATWRQVRLPSHGHDPGADPSDG